ncbi:putative protein RRNAD1-like isoform X1 [Capsicum annuum]|nr:putative protein RRNAD1-like isoform X1 [Capsicum annuum]
MASACMNNVGVSPENFLDYWLSPRRSNTSAVDNNQQVVLDPEASAVNEMVTDFEFRLEDPVNNNMLSADQLFSDGKLMPLQLNVVRPAATPETPKLRTHDDQYARAFSPKAPRCSSRWKELLGLKNKQDVHKNWKSLLNRSSKSSSDDSAPLLKDTDSESVSISSSRLSLSSSSSSGHEHDDLPRLSLDSDKPNLNPNPNPNPPRIRLVKHRALSTENPIPTRLGGSPVLSDDSPRMNSSGKIVFFHNLGRSASSPSSFNNGGGPRYKHGGGGVERSYSANVRVTPVLNVPVCSSLRGSSKSGVFGFPLFSSSSSSNGVSVNKKHHSSSSKPNKTNRIKE